jgi:hypothetical protein
MRKFIAAPLRQNLTSADRFIPPASAHARLCAFARHTFFAGAIAALALTLPFASADPTLAEEQAPAVLSLDFDQQNGTLEIDWSGLIVAGVADELRASVAKYGTAIKRVVLFLDSAGGRVDEGDRVIAVLNEIKRRHRLATVVPHGKLCASMCIPIFLQGDDRFAARASLWCRGVAAAGEWRPANRHDRDLALVPQILRVRRGLDALAQKHRAHDKGADLWQTGGDLIDAKTGIIMYALGVERAMAPAVVETDQATPQY